MGRIAGQEEEEEEEDEEGGTISALSVRSGHSGRRGLDLSSQVRDPPPPLPADLPAIIASIRCMFPVCCDLQPLCCESQAAASVTNKESFMTVTLLWPCKIHGWLVVN